MAGRKVTLAFSVVSVPARLNKAVDDPVSLKTLCVGQAGLDAHDPLPITMPRTCTTCGPITNPNMLVKGVPTDSGFAVVSADDVKEARADTSAQFKGTMNLVPHDAEAFYAATGQGTSLQYVEPEDEKSAKHYHSLAAMIEAHPEYAFATLFTPVSRAALFVARVREGVIVMEERVFNERLRPMPVIAGEADQAYVDVFETLLPTLVAPVDKDTYTDDYTKALAKIAESASDVVTVAGASGPAPTVVGDDDLLAKLKELAAGSAPAKPKAKKKAS